MYHKVLIPLDGSKLAECALPHVRNLAQGVHIEEVILLSVAMFNPPYGIIEGEIDLVPARATKINELQDYLDAVQVQLTAEGIKVETTVIISVNPAHTILDYAWTNSIDLIVMATHGYTGVKRMLLGSVVYEILRKSHMPVLLVRA